MRARLFAKSDDLTADAARLGRLAGQDDVVVGTPSANRGQSEIEGLIGFLLIGWSTGVFIADMNKLLRI